MAGFQTKKQVDRTNTCDFSVSFIGILFRLNTHSFYKKLLYNNLYSTFYSIYNGNIMGDCLIAIENKEKLRNFEY